MSVSQSQTQRPQDHAHAWLTRRKPRAARGAVMVVSAWTDAEKKVLRPFAKLARIPKGAVVALAADLERSYQAVRQRLVLMRREMKEQNGAEGIRARVPRGAPSAAAPVSGLDVSSQEDLAAAYPPPAGAAVSAPAALSGRPKRQKSAASVARIERERGSYKTAKAKVAADCIERRCSNCRAPFVAKSRFLFRCEKCRAHVAAGFDL